MELKRIVRGEDDVHPRLKELHKGVLGDVQEEKVVGQRRQRQPNLPEVEQVPEVMRGIRRCR